MTGRDPFFIRLFTTWIFLAGIVYAHGINAEESQRINFRSRRIDSLEQRLSGSLHDTAKVMVLYNLSMELSLIKPLSALLYADEGLKLAERIHDNRTMARILISTGAIYQMTADYPQAITCYFKALRIGEAHGFISVQSACLNNIGICFTILKQYDQAKKYLKKGLAFTIKKGLNEELAISYNNLADIAMKQGNLYESIAYCKKAIEENSKYAEEISTPFLNMGEAYTKLNQLRNAKYYYKYALKLEQHNNNSYNQIICYLALSKLYIIERNFKEASYAVFKAKSIADHSGVKIFNPEIYEVIARMYAEQGDYNNAYIYKEKFHAVKDAAFNETVTRQINEMQAKYESGKKDNEIQLLNQNSEIAEAKAKRQTLLSGFLIMIVILIVIVSIVLWRNIFLKQKVNNILNDKNEQLDEKNSLLSDKNEQIELQKIDIEQANAKLNDLNRELQKENMSAKYDILKSKINPHFLFNSLSSLSAIVVEDQHLAVEFIDRFSQLYRMILETGEIELITLEQELNIINNYLYLQQMKFGDNVYVDIIITDEMLDYFIPPFSLQMVLENAFKHNTVSVSRKLKIEVTSEGNMLIIKNNLQQRLTKMASTGTGQKNIIGRYKMLSDQLPEFIMTSADYIVKLPLLAGKTQNELIEQG